MIAEQITALLFGVATGILPTGTMLYSLKELREKGLTLAAISAIGLTGAWLGGESWASERIATFLFDKGLGIWVIMGLSGVSGTSGILGLIRFIFSILK